MLHTQTTNNESVCIPNVEKVSCNREGWKERERERERTRDREEGGYSKLIITNSESQGVTTSCSHMIAVVKCTRDNYKLKLEL